MRRVRVPGRVWKWLGVAGVAGVAATGAVVVRDQRRRARVTPDQVRKRLHERLADADRTTGAPTSTPPRAVPAAGPTAHPPVKKRGRR